MVHKSIIISGVTAFCVFCFVYTISILINIPIIEKEERARIEFVKSKTGIDESGYEHLPLILGKREACVVCHDNMKGMEASHAPENIGCFSCHLGNRLAEDKTEAHKGLVLIPGNMSNAAQTCGTMECHPQMIPRMQNNIMNTMNGVVAVDKWVFGESAFPDAKAHVDSILFTPAETHIRNLCASCHLSNEKTEVGGINELSRGGGCLACHLLYTKESESAINDYKKKITTHHPGITVKMNNDNCFGCHSRSGRISLSYDGWHETLFSADDVKGKENFRLLDDGRVVTKIKADVHSEKGMLCVDCHTSYELMGDGSYPLHKEVQVKIECTDCHFTGTPQTSTYQNEEDKKIALLWNAVDSKRSYLTSSGTGTPLINTFYEEGKSYLIKKSSGEKLLIKSPLRVCIEGKAHNSLSCNSCHSSWSAQCIGCHTDYNPSGIMYDLLSNSERKGEWIEQPKDYLAEPAVLGIKETLINGEVKRTVQEFVPGMVLKIQKGNGKAINKRLFAPSFSHTIRKEARSCVSCHNNPQALGYGRGKLDYQIKNNLGTWNFTPQYAISKSDGLPEDAWIGFLKEKGFNSTTRSNLRPFNITEQKSILNAGACLTCHESHSEVMKMALVDFNYIVSKSRKNCIIPFRIF